MKHLKLKTNPIGVRFNIEKLEKLNIEGLASSPQAALNLYESNYWGDKKVVVQDLSKPTNIVKPVDIPASNFSIDTLPKKVKKEYSTDNPHGFDINEKWFLVDKYTKFKKSDCPAKGVEKTSWENQKKKADYELKLAWNQWKQKTKQ